MARVVLCARAAASEVPAIAGALRDRGAEPVLLDCSAVPGAAPVTLGYDGATFRGDWARGEVLGAPRGVAAVWQRLVVGGQLPAMAPGVRETCVAASELAVVGLLDSLQAFQLDPYWSKRRAENKPGQLRVAQRLGLTVPQTLVTSDPQAVRAFAGRVGPLITKMLVQPTAAGPADGEAEVARTTAMTADEVDQLDGLERCPMIFQEQIENQLDVRVTIAGNRMFSFALDAVARGGGGLDWRRQRHALDRAPVWAPYELPRELTGRLARLLDHYGLNYGAVDLIVRPDGHPVFLELDPSGAFAFLGERHAGPIADAIAEVLIDPAARRGASLLVAASP